MSLAASAFDEFGTYFASVVPALDVQKVQISPASESHSVNALNVEYTLPKGVKVQALIWLYSGSGKGVKKTPKKKRKRTGDSSTANNNNSGSSDIENALVAIGTNKGDILLFSPAQGTLTGSLTGVHAVPVTSLAIDSISTTKLWSCDNSGRIGEWDVSSQKNLRSFAFPEPNVGLIQSVPANNGLLLASNTIYLADSNNPTGILKTFPSFVHPTSSIIPSTSNTDFFFASSKNERNVGVISLSKEKTVGLLVAHSNVQELVVNPDSSAVCAVTEDGFVEIFSEPLSTIAESASKKSSAKSRRAQATTSISSTTTIKISRPGTGKKQTVKILNAWFQDDVLIVTWIEHGSIPVFESIKWKEEKTPVIEIVRSVKTLKGKSSELFDSAAAGRYLEGNIPVKSGHDFSKLDTEDAEEQDEDEDEDDEEGGSTLADRLDALEVSDKASQAPTTSLTGKVTYKTPASFTIVLTQALKTNDHALLETCLADRTETFIEASIKRLESSYAVVLLEHIAEKVARSPGRAAVLTVWIKWIIAIHGGYLVSLPNLNKSLAILHSTLANKITALPRLLELYGRIEMLKGQFKLRREILAGSGITENFEEDGSDVDSEVDYIEDADLIVDGEADDDFDSEFEEEEEVQENTGFIELAVDEESDYVSDAEPEDEDVGMSDVDAEGVNSTAGIEYDNEEDFLDTAPVNKPRKTKKTKSKYMLR